MDDGAFDDEDYNQYMVDEVGIIDIGGFTTMDENSCFDNVEVPKGSFTPMDQTQARLYETMVEIIAECTAIISVELSNHVTSLLEQVGSNNHHLCLAQVNESIHSIMVFCWVDDGFGNSINQMKDWHKTMMEHLNTHKKKIRE